MKRLLLAVGIMAAFLAVCIAFSPNNKSSTNVPPLQPIPSTKTVTVTATTNLDTPSPNGNCWNDAAGPGCGTTTAPTTTVAPTGPCGYTIGCQETVPGVPMVPPGGTLPTTSWGPDQYQQYFCDHMNPKPPGCPATTVPGVPGAIPGQVVSYKTAPYSCDGQYNPPPGAICAGATPCWLQDPNCSTTPGVPGTWGPGGYTPPCYGQSWCGGRRSPGY
jgi:hypothetical protein